MTHGRIPLFLLSSLMAVHFLVPQPLQAQAPLKKVRMGSSSTNVSFLALYTAFHRGFFRDEGIDLENIYMPANLASTAVLSGDVDYNGAVTGTIGAAVRGQPMKVLLFTVSKPFLFLVSKKDIKDVKQADLRLQISAVHPSRSMLPVRCSMTLGFQSRSW